MSAKEKWKSACKAWSADKLDQIEETMRLGEVMMFAATSLICEQEARIDELEAERARNKQLVLKALTLADVLKANGFPVSDAAWESASGKMSVQARGLHLAAKNLREALDAWRDIQ